MAQAPDRKGQQVAGKTGTSDDNKSAWFTGYTPNLVTSVGLFGEGAVGTKEAGKQVTLKGAAGGGRVNGGGFPAQIWADFTFGAMGKVTKFDLDTTQGAAVAPTASPSITQSPSTTPSSTPTTQKPTTKPPASSSAPATPSDEPTTSAPATTEPATTPTATSSDDEGLPEDPLDPDSQ